jgi:CO/xanthine dehydrogenase FAD-binding subunit
LRSNIPEYALIAPSDLSDALHLLEKGGWKPFAGGTDLMVLLEAAKLEHKRFFSIAHLPELRGIEQQAQHVVIGAMVTYAEIRDSAVLQAEFPMLCRAARETGSAATQNRGTLGGNIVNASPAADSPPALLCYDAELQLASAQGGTRWVRYDEFHTGYKKMLLRDDELLCAVRLPRRAPGWRDFYRKVGTRRAQAISKVCFAGSILMDHGVVRDIRLALGSVAPVPLRCRVTEAVLRGTHLSAAWLESARNELAREISPIDDMRSTARYRTRVAQNVLTDFLESANR